jgi:hypothetical protein
MVKPDKLLCGESEKGGSHPVRARKRAFRYIFVRNVHGRSGN